MKFKANPTFEADRKIEIEYLTNKINNNQNMLVNGTIGVGKTQLIRHSVKKSKRKLLQEIDAAKITENEIKKGSFYKHIGFWGMISISFDNFLTKFVKYIIPMTSLIYGVMGLLNAVIGTAWYWWLSPVFILILLLVVIGSTTLRYKFVKAKKAVVVVSDLNFVTSEEKIRTIIWLVKHIYGDKALYIFESTEKINYHVQSKFNLSKMHVQNTYAIGNLLWEKVTHLTKLMNYKNLTIGYKKLINYFKEQYESEIHKINELVFMFSYRELETTLNDFIAYFQKVQGEIEILDFLCLKYLETKNLKLLKCIKTNWKEIADFRDRNLASNKENKASTKWSELVKQINKECKNDAEKWVIDKLLPRNSISTNQFKISFTKYSFFKAEYKSVYEGSINYAFLQSHAITHFLEGPYDFFQYLHTNKINIRLINFDLVSDSEALLFLKKFNNEDLDDFVETKQYFPFMGPVDLISHLIYQSRKNEKTFIEKMTRKSKLEIIGHIDEISDKDEFEKLSDIKNMTIDDASFNTESRHQFERKYYKDQKYHIFDKEKYVKKAVQLKRYNLVRRIFSATSSTISLTGSQNQTTKYYVIFKLIKDESLKNKIVKIIREKDKDSWIFGQKNGENLCVVDKGAGPDPRKKMTFANLA